MTNILEIRDALDALIADIPIGEPAADDDPAGDGKGRTFRPVACPLSTEEHRAAGVAFEQQTRLTRQILELAKDVGAAIRARASMADGVRSELQRVVREGAVSRLVEVRTVVDAHGTSVFRADTGELVDHVPSPAQLALGGVAS